MRPAIQKKFLVVTLTLLSSTSLMMHPGYAQSLAPSTNPSATPIQGTDAGPATNQNLSTQAQKFIQDLGNHAIAIIADKSLTQSQRDEKYHNLLQTAFDIKTIGHFVIGRAYESATPQQQQEYLKLFEQLVIKIYSDRLNLYSGETFQVKGARPESERDVMVNSEIVHPDGSPPTTVDWRVRQKDGKLAIIDVVVEGISQSVTQRQEYSSIVQRDGMDGLLAQMRQRVQDNVSASPNTQ